MSNPLYRNAIASIESAGSGGYSALGPNVRGDRAYGKYQVMGANIPSWTKEALGYSMTPEEFLASPEAQDAVFDHRFGGYVQKYGPEGAASMWFSGDPTPDGDSDYVSKFSNALGGDPLQQVGTGFNPNTDRINALMEMASRRSGGRPQSQGDNPLSTYVPNLGMAWQEGQAAGRRIA
jgi:hypothetical protein